MKPQDSFGQAVTVSGLLAGFSFTAVIGLLAIERASAAFDTAFYAFLIATFLFIASTLGSWGVLEWIIERGNTEYQEQPFYTATIVSFLLGLLAFVVGVIGAAFLHSTMAGSMSIAAGIAVLGFFIATTFAVSSR